MTNFKFTNQLVSHKNEILNYFKSFSENFYFNFLSSNEKVGGMQIGTRTQNLGAHIRVQYFEQDGSFKKYQQEQLYYITFNTLKNSKDLGFNAFSIRKDLLQYWSDKDVSKMSILVIDNNTKMIYSVGVPRLMSKYGQFISKKLQSKEVIVLNPESPYVDITFSLTSDIIKDEKSFCSSPYAKGTNGFDDKYYKPEYISNFVYSIYRQKTSVVLHQYGQTGNYIKSRTFRSIKEIYDILVKFGYDKTYKTLQRAAITEELITLEKVDATGKKNIFTFYLSKDLEAGHIELEAKRIIDETAPNPFYNPEQPYDEFSNFPDIITKDHYELSKKKKIIPRNDKLSEVQSTFEEEIHYLEKEEELIDFNATKEEIEEYEIRKYYSDDEPTLSFVKTKIDEKDIKPLFWSTN